MPHAPPAPICVQLKWHWSDKASAHSTDDGAFICSCFISYHLNLVCTHLWLYEHLDCKHDPCFGIFKISCIQWWQLEAIPIFGAWQSKGIANWDYLIQHLWSVFAFQHAKVVQFLCHSLPTIWFGEVERSEFWIHALLVFGNFYDWIFILIK